MTMIRERARRSTLSFSPKILHINVNRCYFSCYTNLLILNQNIRGTGISLLASCRTGNVIGKVFDVTLVFPV